MIDEKEFLALKASDVVKERMKLLSSIDKEIEMWKEEKISKEELNELNEQGVCKSIVNVLEDIREKVEDAFWIDQLGDLD